MSPYRALLARPGTPRLAAASGLAWWAFNGYALALVLTVQHATASFTIAGASTAAFGVGSALFAPIRGRAVDRGGGLVLLRLASAHVAALTLILSATLWIDRPSTAVVLTAAGVAGATAPPLTATSRRVWTHLSGPELARSAHALNALLGEIAALASPVVTSVLAAATSPVVALGVLLPGTALASAGIASAIPDRATATSAGGVTSAEGAASKDGTVPSTSSARQRSILRDSPGLRWLVAGDVASGLWLGGLEISGPAVGLEGGQHVLVGAPFAALAVGGIAASLWAGSSAARGRAAHRYVAGAISIAAVMPMATVANDAIGLALACAAAGVGYGLLNVALFELIDDVADDVRATEAFTWITTAQASGLAIGAAIAGALADAGAGLALVFTCAVPLSGAAIAVAGNPTLRRGRRRPQAQPSL